MTELTRAVTLILVALVSSGLAHAQGDELKRLAERAAGGERAALSRILELGDVVTPFLDAALPGAPEQGRIAIAEALAGLRTPSAHGILHRLLFNDPSADVRLIALRAFGRRREVSLLSTYIAALGDPDLRVAHQAVLLLTERLDMMPGFHVAAVFDGRPVFAPYLLDVLVTGSAAARRVAARSLATMPISEDRLLALLEPSTAASRSVENVAVILQLSADRYPRVLDLLLSSPSQSPTEVIEVLKVAARYGGEEPKRFVRRTLDEPPYGVVIGQALRAADSLRLHGTFDQALRHVKLVPTDALPILLRHDDGRAADACRSALEDEGWRKAWPVPALRFAAALATLSGAKHEALIREVLREAPTGYISADAVGAFPKAARPWVIEDLEARLGARDGQADRIAEMLIRLGHTPAIERAIQSVRQSPLDASNAVVDALVALQEERMVEPLFHRLRYGDPTQQDQARRALQAFGSRDVLIRLLEEADPEDEATWPDLTPTTISPILEQLDRPRSPKARLVAATMIARSAFMPRNPLADGELEFVLAKFLPLLSEPDVRLRRLGAEALIASASSLWFREPRSQLAGKVRAASVSALADPDEQVRAKALGAATLLTRAGGDEAEEIAALALPMLWYPNAELKAAAARAAALSNDDAVWRELLLLARSPLPESRSAARGAIRWGLRDELSFGLINDPDLRWTVLERFAWRGGAAAQEVRRLLREGDPEEQLRALETVRRSSAVAQQYEALLFRLVDSAVPDIRERAREILRMTNLQYALEDLERSLKSVNPRERRAAVSSFMVYWAAPEGVPILATVFDGWDFALQEAAIDALGQINSPEARELLALVAAGSDAPLAAYARFTLEIRDGRRRR
ncbi:MAG: hypothetical protein AB1725_04920 [Armatimonadota bacterium]